ncbi:MAG: hypothetical protein ACFFDN_06885 [Candidatus Hodarchaeota archaeon]
MAEKIWTFKELNELKKKIHCECWKKINHDCILGDVEYYEHDGGDFLEGLKEKQWIYFTCKRCNYQWSLHKILNRIEREKFSK